MNKKHIKPDAIPDVLTHFNSWFGDLFPHPGSFVLPEWNS